MANAYFVYDTNGNITTAKTSYPTDLDTFSGAQILVIDVLALNVSNALAQPKNFMVQNGQIVPSVTLQIAVSRSYSVPWNLYELTVTASDNAEHDVDLNILGYVQALKTGGTVKVAVHQAISTNLETTISGQGVIPNHVSLTTGISTMRLHVYAGADGVLYIAPTQRTDLVAYYTKVVPPELSTADLTTSDSLLMQTVFGIILPALTNGTSPLITLDANQQNALADLQSNVLPNIVTTLENAAPAPVSGQPQSFDMHYKSYRDDLAIAKQAFDQYVLDVQSIPNLV